MKFLEGSLYMEYEWNLGLANSYFFENLKNKKIMGAKCPHCKTVFVPPRLVCNKCLKKTVLGIEVKDEGEIISFTEVIKKFPESPKPLPFKLGLIRLEGADTYLLHLVEGELQIGDRVKARWREKTSGDILDIECFKKEN